MTSKKEQQQPPTPAAVTAVLAHVEQASVNLDFRGLGSLLTLWHSHITLGPSKELKGEVM